MIYEVRATMFFDQENEADDFFHDCQVALPKATVVNPGQENQQCSETDLIKCQHDAHPPKSCTLNTHIDNCPLETY